MAEIPVKQEVKTEEDMRPWLQLMLLFGLLLLFLIVFAVSSLGLIGIIYGKATRDAIVNLNPGAPHILRALWIFQLGGTTLPILATAIFFTLNTRKPFTYLKLNNSFPWVLLILVLGIALVDGPSIELLSNINHKIPLPSFLNFLENTQEAQKQVMAVMMNMKNVWYLIFNVICIGLFTAISEELLFRGCFQTVLLRSTKNIHAAVWITAIIFSAIHFDFYGFLPRILLGGIFGYMVAWSGSIWTSIWAHFINNSAIVFLTYLSQQKMISISPDDQHVFDFRAYVFSILLVIFLFWLYHRVIENKRGLQVNGEELG